MGNNSYRGFERLKGALSLRLEMVCVCVCTVTRATFNKFPIEVELKVRYIIRFTEEERGRGRIDFLSSSFGVRFQAVSAGNCSG